MFTDALEESTCPPASPTLKMETVRSSEAYVNIFLTLRRYIPEDSNAHNHDNRKFPNLVSVLVAFK